MFVYLSRIEGPPPKCLVEPPKITLYCGFLFLHHNILICI